VECRKNCKLGIIFRLNGLPINDKELATIVSALGGDTVYIKNSRRLRISVMLTQADLTKKLPVKNLDL